MPGKQNLLKNVSYYAVFIPRCYTTKLNQHSISFRGPSIWNSLPVSIKDRKQSVKMFAKKIF